MQTVYENQVWHSQMDSLAPIDLRDSVDFYEHILETYESNGWAFAADSMRISISKIKEFMNGGGECYGLTVSYSGVKFWTLDEVREHAMTFTSSWHRFGRMRRRNTAAFDQSDDVEQVDMNTPENLAEIQAIIDEMKGDQQ